MSVLVKDCCHAIFLFFPRHDCFGNLSKMKKPTHPHCPLAKQQSMSYWRYAVEVNDSGASAVPMLCDFFRFWSSMLSRIIFHTLNWIKYRLALRGRHFTAVNSGFDRPRRSWCKGLAFNPVAVRYKITPTAQTQHHLYLYPGHLSTNNEIWRNRRVSE